MVGFLRGGQIVSPNINPSLITVKDLFIPDTKVWNKELIEQNFLPWEAERIQSIPVSHYPMEDLLIWPLTTDGITRLRVHTSCYPQRSDLLCLVRLKQRVASLFGMEFGSCRYLTK